MNKKVILISGKIGSGKSTFGSFLNKYLPDSCQVSFAQELKDFCAKEFQPFLDLINREYGDTLSPENWYEKKTPITRMLLQLIGTNTVRKIDNNYWSHKLIQKIKNIDKEYFIITDWRFPSEYAEILKEFSVKTIRIETPYLNQKDSHISEIALDDVNEELFDIIIQNTGTLRDLEEKAEVRAIDMDMNWV